MAGDQKLHALAQDEFITHAFAIAVTRIHQSLQQIVAGWFVAALPYVFEQNGVGAGSHVFVSAQFARDGEPGIQIGLKGLPDNRCASLSSFQRTPSRKPTLGGMWLIVSPSDSRATLAVAA